MFWHTCLLEFYKFYVSDFMQWLFKAIVYILNYGCGVQGRNPKYTVSVQYTFISVWQTENIQT